LACGFATGASNLAWLPESVGLRKLEREAMLTQLGADILQR